MAAIFLVSGQSQPHVPGGISNTAGHVIAYAGLCLLVLRAVAGGLPARITRQAAAVSLGITIAYGVSDEVHQMFVPGRMPDVLDVCADAGGALLTVTACWAWGILADPKAQDSSPRT